MFLDTLSISLPGKRKLILYEKGAGRRHLMFGVPNNTPSQLLPIMNPELDDHSEE